MGARKRPRLRLRELALLGAIILGAAAVVGALLAADIRLGVLIGGGGDFFAIWAGARAFVTGQAPPYSAEAARLAQRLAYGGAAGFGDNPYRLEIPFFLLPIFFPLALTSSAAVARGIWLCLGQAALVGSVVVSLVVIEWRPPRGTLVLLGAATVLGLYSVAAMFSGTPAILLALLYPTILWALQTGQDELAGSLLAFGCFLWEVGALFLVLIVWRMLYEKHGGAWAGLAMTLVILLATSFLLYPGWLLPFLTAIVAQLRAGPGIGTSEALLHIWPEHGTQLARVLAVCFGALFVYEWWSARHADSKRFVWICLLALSVTPLLGLRTELGNLVVLAPSVALIAAGSVQRTRGGAGLAIAAIGVALVIPWFLAGRWAVLHDAVAYDYLFLFYPCFSIAGLYWTRWWFLRPNRTWMDDVRALRA